MRKLTTVEVLGIITLTEIIIHGTIDSIGLWFLYGLYKFFY